MNINDYSSFIHYFRQCACESKHIKDFQHGNSERIINAERSKRCYPVFWLEDPDISLVENCGLSIRFNSAFVILFNGPLDDWKTEDYNLQSAFHIAMEFLLKMNNDATENCFFDFDLSKIQIDRVHTVTHDNDWGWRVSFEIITTTGLCVEECAWLGVCPAGAMAKFKWNNTINGTFEGLEITDCSRPENHDWIYEWSYSIDAGTTTVVNNEMLVIEGDGRFIYVCLKITDENGCVQCASAIFNNDCDCGFSVPYHYKPKGY